MNKLSSQARLRIWQGMLRLSALAFLAAGLFHYRFLASLLSGAPLEWFAFQLICLGAGLGLIVIDALLSRSPFLQRWLLHDTIMNASLACFSVFFVFGLAELALRPFAHFGYRDVSIFEERDDLRWGLRPNHQGEYGGVTVTVDSNGLRAPDEGNEIEQADRRILFIGDSVTFGLRLPYDDSIPARAQRILNASSGLNYQCVNAGVPGYSALQTAMRLEKLAPQVEPGMVVYTFVLNDVLTTYTALRFESYGADDPTPYIQRGLIDWLHQNSGLAYFIKRGYYQLRFGRTLHQSAVHQEQMDVESLVETPDHEEIENAWLAVEEQLERIDRFCKQRELPWLLAVSPYKFQLREPQKNAPQLRLMKWAGDANVTAIDLLPLAVETMARDGLEPDELLMDFCHPTADGAQWIASQLIPPIKAALSPSAP